MRRIVSKHRSGFLELESLVYLLSSISRRRCDGCSPSGFGDDPRLGPLRRADAGEDALASAAAAASSSAADTGAGELRGQCGL